MRRFHRFTLFALALTVLAAPVSHAWDEGDAAYIREHFSKFEYRIPMRDGVRLFTAVYVPNDGRDGHPILMRRTPYRAGPYGADRYPDRLGPDPRLLREGLIFVEQDVRGRFRSEGTFVNMRPHLEAKHGPTDVDESTDTYDTVEWLIRHVPGNNGKVGLWGVSYPGFYTSAGIIDSHPAIVAASPEAPIADWFWDDMHRNGAFNLVLAFDFFSVFGRPRSGPTGHWPETLEFGTADAYDFFLRLGPLGNADERLFHGEIPFWKEIASHPNYDAFWQARNILPHLKNVGCAVLVVGGWFDTEDLYGPLATYRAIERQNPGTENRLVMGPWPHGGWIWGDGRRLGEADFGFPTAEWFRREVLVPFFLHHLLGRPAPELPEALVFETGANRWRRFPAWPPENATPRPLYLREDHALAFKPPEGAGGSDQWISDPAKPVPYTTEITTRWARNYMTEDQRFAARRPDVLVYETEALTEDLTVAGPLEADLWVATSARDMDLVVKVVDVFPEEPPRWIPSRATAETPDPDLRGTQRLIRAEAFRGRFRSSFEHPQPFQPGRFERVRFELHDVLHTFQKGHRIMVQIQSTWFPFIDRNPQSWVDNIFEARPEDFVAATHRVERSPEHPSRIVLPVLTSRE